VRGRVEQGCLRPAEAPYVQPRHVEPGPRPVVPDVVAVAVAVRVQHQRARSVVGPPEQVAPDPRAAQGAEVDLEERAGRGAVDLDDVDVGSCASSSSSVVRQKPSKSGGRVPAGRSAATVAGSSAPPSTWRTSRGDVMSGSRGPASSDRGGPTELNLAEPGCRTGACGRALQTWTTAPAGQGG
jgi:hypothetical protein